MNIVLIGKPGAGKGSISQILKEQGFLQLATGDLLRAEIAKKTPLGGELKALLDQGKFASDEVIFGMVENFLAEHAGEHVIFDGYPRNYAQAVKAKGVIDKVIYLDTPDEVIMERISNRWVHAPSGRVYNLKTLPSKIKGRDDVTGEPLVQRDDDKPEVVRARLDTFMKATWPVWDLLKTRKDSLVLDTTEGTLEEQAEIVRKFVVGKHKPKL